MPHSLVVGSHVDRDEFLRRWVGLLTNFKGPEKSGCESPLRTLCEVDARTDAAAGSIAVVVAILVVGASGVRVGELVKADEAIGVVGFGVFVACGLTQVEGPAWEDDGRILGDQIALVIVVLESTVGDGLRKADQGSVCGPPTTRPWNLHRVDSHRFLDDAVDVRNLFHVLELGEPTQSSIGKPPHDRIAGNSPRVATNGIELSASLLLELRVHGQVHDRG